MNRFFNRSVLTEISGLLSSAKHTHLTLAKNVTKVEGKLISASHAAGVEYSYPDKYPYNSFESRLGSLSYNLEKLERELDLQERREHEEDEHPDFKKHWMIGG